jgi:hypothetical protein
LGRGCDKRLQGHLVLVSLGVDAWSTSPREDA